MLDIHAHLFWNSYDHDRDEVIARAKEAGVTKIICVGTSPEDNRQAIAIAEQYEEVYASVGLHPHFFNEIEKKFQISNFKFQNNFQNPKSKIQNQSEKGYINEVIVELQNIAKSSEKIVAIGECGLDYFTRDQQPTHLLARQAIDDQQKKIQKEGFLAQMVLAQELGLPLIMHTRPSIGSQDAYEDILALLQAKSGKLKAILHCYQGDTETTKKFLGLPDVYFSFAGTITYPVKSSTVGAKDDPIETVKLVPLERMFVETDCPFLAPQGKRGERNEPAYVRMTAEKVCVVKGISISVLDQELEKNFKGVFRFKKT